MGEAATLNAIASQHLLPKPGFDTLRGLVEECDLYGINVAHSGSVVGLMLDRQRHDIGICSGGCGSEACELWPGNICCAWCGRRQASLTLQQPYLPEAALRACRATGPQTAMNP